MPQHGIKRNVSRKSFNAPPKDFHHQDFDEQSRVLSVRQGGTAAHNSDTHPAQVEKR
jgi:hypothetical protein